MFREGVSQDIDDCFLLLERWLVLFSKCGQQLGIALTEQLDDNVPEFCGKFVEHVGHSVLQPARDRAQAVTTSPFSLRFTIASFPVKR